MQIARRPGDTPAKEEPPALRPAKVPVEILPLEDAEQQHRAAVEAVAAFRVEMSRLAAELDNLKQQRANDWDNPDLRAQQSRCLADNEAAPLRLAYLLSDERDALAALAAVQLYLAAVASIEADAHSQDVMRRQAELLAKQRLLERELDQAKNAWHSARMSQNRAEDTLRKRCGFDDVQWRAMENLAGRKAQAEKQNERQDQHD